MAGCVSAMNSLSAKNATARVRHTQPSALSTHQRHASLSLMPQHVAPQQCKSLPAFSQQPRTRVVTRVGSFFNLFKSKVAAPAVDPRGAQLVDELIQLTKKGGKQSEKDEEIEELVR